MALDNNSNAASWIDLAQGALRSLAEEDAAFGHRLKTAYEAMDFAWREAGGAQGGEHLADAERALDYAAHHSLSLLFPAHSALFDRMLSDKGFPLAPAATDAMAQLGIAAAQGFVTRAEQGGLAASGLAIVAGVSLSGDGDVALGDANERFVSTDPGENAIAGAGGNDTLLSGGGNDVLDGGADDDLLIAGAGADVLIGAGGADVLTGGPGGDIFAFDAADPGGASGPTVERITDFTPGVDRVELTGFDGLTDFASLSFTPQPGGPALSLPGNRLVIFEGLADETALGPGDFVFADTPRQIDPTGFTRQSLTDADDRYIVAGPDADTVMGLDGDDAIVSGGGGDLLSGDGGDDVLIGGAGGDTLSGGAGRDVLTGGAGADLFRILAADDAPDQGFVLDTITDFESGTDTVQLEGFAGITAFADLDFVALADGVGVDLGGGRFLLFDGIDSAEGLATGDFDFGDAVAPLASLALASDTGTSDSDALTSDPGLTGSASDNAGLRALEISFGTTVGFVSILDLLDEAGDFSLTRATLEDRIGETLPDGLYNVELRATDLSGRTTSANLRFTFDDTPPQITTAPTGALAQTVDSLVIGFDGPVGEAAFDVASYALMRAGEGAVPEITSATRIDDQTVRLNLSTTLENADFTLDIGALTDAAGNSSEATSRTFSVDAATRVVATQPADGGQQANLDRKIVVEFDRAVNPDTIDGDAIQVLASGTALEGRLTLSSNGKIATFFPDELLPASTQLRIMVDGDAITGADGRAVDADGDGEAGGVLEADFSTVSLTPVAGTNVEGFIFDANNRDAEGNDIPLEGIVVSVVGLPGVTAVTDATGRFLLEDLPVGKVFLDFDASNVVGREGLDFGTLQRPVQTQAGQTTTTNLNGSPLSIFFAALSEGDAVQITPGEATEAGIGANGVANLSSIFPDIDPAEWEKVKVIIPPDSLTNDDGTPATEVTVMAFEPDRIPGPLPDGFDPTVVFTIKAGDATNSNGNAQIEFPNIDGLAPGTIRPILSFDHDAGEWVQTGTAIVSADGERLVSEGDTGVNTFGWKAVGDDPLVPVEEDPKSHSDLNIGRDAFDTVRDGVATVFSGASTAVSGIDTAINAADIFVPDAGIGTLPNFAATLTSTGLSVIADAFSTAEGDADFGFVSQSTLDSFGAGVTVDLLSIGEVVGEVPATGIQAGLTVVAAKGTVDQFGAFLENGTDFASGVAEWGGIFGNSVSDFVGGFFGGNVRNLANALPSEDELQLIQDFSLAQVRDISAAIGTVAEVIDGVVRIADAMHKSSLLVNDLREAAEQSGTADPIPLPADQTAEVLEAIALAQESLTGFLETFGDKTIGEILREAAQNVTDSTSDFRDLSSLALSDSGRVLYAYTLDDGTVFRGESDSDGKISLLLPPGQRVEISYYDPETGFVTQDIIDTARDPEALGGDRIIFERDTEDNDGDGLGAIAEFVVGTSDDNPDSDDDGVLDGAEVAQGLNPLDGIGFPTGIIGSVALQGEALDVTVTGATDGTPGQTAFVATGSHGLAIVDATQFSNPILQSQLDLPGTAKQVAVDSVRGVAYVAADQGGLHIVDVTDPQAPVVTQTISIAGGAQAVIDLGGTILVGGGQGDIALINAATGTVLTEVDAGRRINDFALDGDTLYAVVDNRFLASFRIDGAQITELNRIEFPQSTIRTVPEDKQVFVNEGVAYVANGLEVINVPLFRLEERGGYLTYDVSDPEALSLISNIDTPRVQAGNLETVVNGSGLALVAGGFRGLQVHNAQDPDVTFDLLAEFATPGNAKGVALASGIAYVADGVGGLQVVNVLPFDANGVAPTISFDAQAADADPETAGVQIEEGTRVALSLDIQDDVQVRNVELLLNGEVVLNDVSAPFNLSFDAPSLASLGDDTALSVQLRATDTGGNATTTEAVTFNVIEDITPPELLDVVPADGRLVLAGREVVTVSFSERINQTTFTVADVSLVPVGGGDPIAPSDIVFLGQGQVAQISFDPLPLGAYEITLDTPGVTDLGGNPLGGDPVVQGFEVVDATAVWNLPEGGSWFTPENWREGTVPTSQDGVAIVLDDDATVAINSFSEEARADRIRLGSGTLELQRGTLETREIEGNGGTFRQTGGELSNTNLLAGPDFNIEIDGFARNIWTGVTLGANASVSGNYGGYLQLQDGNTINGTLSVEPGRESGNSRLTLYGTQSVEGTGQITLMGGGLYLQRDFSLPFTNYVAPEATLGAGLGLTGQGTLSSFAADGSFTLLGQVTADGGELSLRDIDQRGGTLSLTSVNGGFVEIDGRIDDATIATAEGADVRLRSNEARDITLAGPGVTRLTGGTIDTLTVDGQARIESPSPTGFVSVGVDRALEIDGTLELAGNSSQARLDIRDPMEIGGEGTLLLSRANAPDGAGSNNQVQFFGRSSANQTEILTLGEGLTLTGSGRIAVSDADDRLRVEGTILGNDEGSGQALILEQVDQGGGTLSVDSTNGAVRVVETLEDAVLAGTGMVELGNGLDLRDVTLDMGALVGASYTSPNVDVFSGLTINDTLQIAPGAENRSSTLSFRGEQSVDGTGRIELVPSGFNGYTSSDLRLLGTSSFAETLTFGAGLTIAGSGEVFANSSNEDSLRILGTLEGGPLAVYDLDKDGAAVTVDASEGEVRLFRTVQDTRFEAAEGQTGEVTFQNNVRISDSIFDMNAVIGNIDGNQTVFAENDLTVNGTFTIQANGTRAAVLEATGAQMLGGTGEIFLSSAGAAEGVTPVNQVRFDGILGSDETFIIGADLTVRGTGSVFSRDAADLIRLDGRMIADDGTLAVEDLLPVEGRLGATADGLLDFNSQLLLSERAVLEFGFSNDSHGNATIQGTFAANGTLALDVAEGFTATTGDTFVIATASGAITGTFDAFEGFDLAGNQAFELIRPDQNTLAVRVTDDATAEARGFINGDPFTPQPALPDSTEDIQADLLEGLVQGVRVTGPATAGQTPEIATQARIAETVFATDLSTTPTTGDVFVTFEQGLTLEGGSTVSFGASTTAESRVTFQGAQMVDGTGTLLFERAEGQTNASTLLTAPRLAAGERVTFAEGIEIAGHVDIAAQGNPLDSISVLGTLRGVAGSTLTVNGLDNDGAAVTIDGTEGRVLLTGDHTETVFEGTGTLGIASGTEIRDVTFGLTTRLGDDDSFGDRLDVDGGLVLDQATLEIVSDENESSLVDFNGAQSVGGTGTIHLIDTDEASSTGSTLRLLGQTDLDEVLTFEAGITLRGEGQIGANSSNDNVRILGTVAGESGGLRLSDIDNGGAALSVDTSMGDVGFTETLSNTRLELAGGPGMRLENSLELYDVTVAGDARIGGNGSYYGSSFVTAFGGLVVENAALDLVAGYGGTSRLTLRGEQSLGGFGGIVRLDSNQAGSLGGAARSQLYFQGEIGREEIFGIGAGLDVIGNGDVLLSNGDRLDILGDLAADDGRLRIAGEGALDGTVGATQDGELILDRALGLTDESQVSVGLGGAGLDAQAGRIATAGTAVLDGTFAFDIADGFAAGIGDEFLVLTADEGITGQFDTVTGAAIDDSRALALVQQDSALFARVVAAGQAGQQVLRSDLASLPFVPETLTDETLDAAMVGGPQALLVSNNYTATWSGVTQDVDVTFQLPVSAYGVSRNLALTDGFTLNGDLRLDPFSNSGYGRTTLRFDGDMDVTGTGAILLESRGALPGIGIGDGIANMYFRGASDAADTLTLGADIELIGAGTVSASGDDRWQILGDVTARGTAGLDLRQVDQGGSALSLDSAAGGFVDFDTGLANAPLTIAAGADVRLTGGSFTNVGITGPGSARLSGGSFDGLDIGGSAFVAGTNSSFVSVRVDGGLNVDGLLELRSGGNANLRFSGPQTVEGEGTLRLGSGVNEATTTLNNTVILDSQTTEGSEILTFGEMLTIEGAGRITTSRAEDAIRILGEVVGRDNGTDKALVLERVDQATPEGRGALSVDTSAGEVQFTSTLSNAALAGSGQVGLMNGLDLNGVTLGMDALVQDGTVDVLAAGGLTVNAVLALETEQNRTNQIFLRGAQTVDGTGRIELSDGVQSGSNINRLLGISESSTETEIFTFGSGITIAGAGRVETNRNEDSLRILGTLEGSADGALEVSNLDNAGATVLVDSSVGQVVLGDFISNTTFASVAGQSAEVNLRASADLNAVTFDLDAILGEFNATESAFVTGGLTVNGQLTLAAGTNRTAELEFDGAQTLGGTGTVILSDARSPFADQPFNRLDFDGLLAEAESFVIASGVTVQGTGTINVIDAGDTLAIEGSVLADNGVLEISNGARLEPVSGTLGVMDDAILEVRDGFGLAAGGTLRIGLSDQGVGRIDLTGNATLDQGGTLALDVADSFVFTEGDTFEIVTGIDTLSGDFANFDGFDLDGNLAFELIQPTADTLALRVTTDDLATPFIDIA
jgi:hypothetical protein